jgi:Fe-S cluster biogenesis protein NfuA
MVRAQRGSTRESKSNTAAGDALETRAKHLVEQVLRPLIAADGGVIEFVSVSAERLVIRLTGTCAGCPGRPYTLRGVVERAAHKALGADMQVELSEN